MWNVRKVNILIEKRKVEKWGRVSFSLPFLTMKTAVSTFVSTVKVK